MDSLQANYASSDEEEEKSPQLQPSNSKSTGFLSSLSPPKSSSFSSSPLFLSLPLNPPISSSSSSPNLIPHGQEQEERPQSLKNLESWRLSASLPKPSSSSLFFSLPQPKSSSASSSLFSSLPQPTKTHSSPEAQLPGPTQSATKKVVQFRPPPINPSSNVKSYEDEDDEDDEYEEEKQNKQPVIQTASVKSFLSSIPAPRNSATLGALPSASGSGRRSIIDADVPGLKDSNVVNAGSGSEVGVSTNIGNKEDQSGNEQTSMSSSGGVSDSSGYAIGGGGDYSSWGSGSENYANYAGYGGYENSGGSGVAGDYQNWGGGSGDSVNYSGDYGNYANCGPYEINWGDGSTASVAPEVFGLAENAWRVSGKRGRNSVPQEIVEVKQDELMKNRPREDQVKLTGIAFGPAYQPTSTKGKPSKLHKRKHQIGSLYFDMKQKETELAERRAGGFLTKAQTQGKYGW